MAKPKTKGGVKTDTTSPKPTQPQHAFETIVANNKTQPKRAARKTTASADNAPVASAAFDLPSASVGDGRQRVVIDAVLPIVDGGRFAPKRIAGEVVDIEAHCFTDGHDKLRAVLTWAALDDDQGADVEMMSLPNDVWTAQFVPPRAGRYRYTVTAWVDHFESWRGELERRTDTADVRIAFIVGAALVDETAARATQEDRSALSMWAAELRRAGENHDAGGTAELKSMALDTTRAALARRYPNRELAQSVTLELIADRKRAAYSTWYELFPRSAGSEPGRHGTFNDVTLRLPYIAAMGFDVVYMPPIHPVGRKNRKGPNNSLVASETDVGSPWAIGAVEGGHKDILAELGTLEDFRSLVRHADELGMEIALDIAFQCAPDHPYVIAHPEWFKHRPDGSVQYAENPPKKYQDIYPFDFETADWRALWAELKSVFDYWITQGVRIFRVDNPHTKSFAFWEWAITEVKKANPDVIFLAEAFTRPKVMHRLAKLGFTQSYTYFTWRTSKQELTDYFTELSQGPGVDYFRPNVWPNTPDILHEALHSGQRQTYAARLVLAATLSANYGMYGPAYELLESTPREHGSEEYRDSEKYQLRHWNLDRADSLRPLIERVNHIRRDNPALQSDATLNFCAVDNAQLIAYTKHDAASGHAILTVVNLDPNNTQSGWLDLDLAALGINTDQPYQAHDLLSGQRFIWRGGRAFVQLNPFTSPAHIFALRRRVRSEQDFDYYT